MTESVASIHKKQMEFTSTSPPKVNPHRYASSRTSLLEIVVIIDTVPFARWSIVLPLPRKVLPSRDFSHWRARVMPRNLTSTSQRQLLLIVYSPRASNDHEQGHIYRATTFDLCWWYWARCVANSCSFPISWIRRADPDHTG